MKDTMKYVLNQNKLEQSEKIFEGISNGRKKALENWFKDRWIQIEVIKKVIVNAQSETDDWESILSDSQKKYHTFVELFLTDKTGTIIASSFKNHEQKNISGFPNLSKGLNQENYMYGPYCDQSTLELDLSTKSFFDEVTLLFSSPLEINDTFMLLCARVLNDDMSNIIQEEDTHFYKDSGDNYLFMIKNNRNIPQGMAISRSRFEDNTFTLGDNLKDGIKTKRWGDVKIKEHTELEIMFTDPATGGLHQGVQNTITKRENLNCWPGYPDYRHVLVGGKGTTIEPPFSDEVWGMMCEGDISDIYNYTNLNRRIPMFFGFLALSAIGAQELLQITFHQYPAILNLILWIYLIAGTYVITKLAITKPLNNVTKIVQDIAEGEGNLKNRVTVSSTNEIGQLIRWINRFISNQMNMIKRVKNALAISKSTVKTVSASNVKIQDSIHKIENAVQILSNNSAEQNHLFNATQHEVKKISDSFEKNSNLDELLQSMKEKTEATTLLARNSDHMQTDTESANQQLEHAMSDAVASIVSLEQESKEITKIVSTISGISSQTSLLALNASIEAARVGEAGKGFAVVAEEIKKLSEGTNFATGTIAKLISSIQKEIYNTNHSIIRIEEKVKTSIKHSTESMKAVGLIIDISKTISYILEIMSEQSTIIKEVKSNIISMSKQNENNTIVGEKSSKETLELVSYIIKQTEKLSKVVESLEYSTEDLEEIIEGFVIE